MLNRWINQLRDRIRLNSNIARMAYMIANQRRRFSGRLLGLRASPANNGKIALCLRFRDEARYLAEWLDYYLAAGVDHFFLYNNNSVDEYETLLQPYIHRQQVTLINWPYVPASPAAEEDCIRKSIGKFSWVGFLDADEFVVIADGRSIPEFLQEFSGYPGVALHWYFFGSNGHRKRPDLPVLQAYTRRRGTPDGHVKLFVRPEAVTECNNPHSWFFRNAGVAVDECYQSVCGSRSEYRNAKRAWINHYYTKSEEDYLKRTMQKNTADRIGMQAPSRTSENMRHHLTDNNQIESFEALEYLEKRRASGKTG